jgi:hypothetical protein
MHDSCQRRFLQIVAHSLQRTATFSRRVPLPGPKSALIAALSIALIAGSAHAYRPFDLTDAAVAKRHNFEIALGPAEFVSVDADHSLRLPNLSINYGLATGRELTLEGANSVTLQSTPGEPRAQREDLEVAMKQVLHRGSLQDAPGPSLAIEGALLVPDRGQQHLGGAANFILSSESKLGASHFNVEGERLPEGRNACSAGVIFEASDHFGLAPGIELRTEGVDGGPPEHSAILGLIYVPGEQAEYDVALRFARSGDEEIFEIRAGFTFQFSVHTLEAVTEAAIHPSQTRRRRH